MFFFFGIMPVQEKIPYGFSGVCSRCGKVCKYEIISTASCFSIFFIPLFKFGKKYLVQVSCCNNIYLLNNDIGKKIENGEDIIITDQDLTPLEGDFSPYHTCPNCGYEVKSDFVHCPKCGKKL